MKPRPITILPDLIDRTKVAAHELDNAVARRFERMLITVAGGDASANDSSFSLGLLDGLIVSHHGHTHKHTLTDLSVRCRVTSGWY